MSPTNGSVAPACPISRSQAVPGMPGSVRAYIPRAVDLASAIAAVNAINQALAAMVNQVPDINNVGQMPLMSPSKPLVAGDFSHDPGGGGPQRKRSRWKEYKRTTQKWRFYRKKDVHDNVPVSRREAWVEVERIEYIEWRDKSRGTKLIFEYGEGKLDELYGTKQGGAVTIYGGIKPEGEEDEDEE
jgi:hypothetical protein